MQNISKRVTDKIYENFFMRDITCIFGGILILGSIYYSFEKNLLEAIEFITQNIFRFIIFLFISYLVGMINKFGFVFIKIFKTTVYYYGPNQYTFYSIIQKECGDYIIRKIEREFYFMNVGASIGSASLISALIFLFLTICSFETVNLVFFLILAIFTLISLVLNSKVVKQLDRDLSSLYRELHLNKEKKSMSKI